MKLSLPAFAVVLVPILLAAHPAPATEGVAVKTTPVPGDQDVFTLSGVDPRSKAVGVFLHGWCSHGLGYLQAFQWAAAEKARFISLQGDVRCGTPAFRGWSHDIAKLDGRIGAALHEYLPRETPTELLVAGASQGVDRAAALSRLHPEKYTRLILLSGPHAVSPRGLKHLRGAVLFVGEHENQAPTRETEVLFRRAGIPVMLRVLPDAGHAEFHGRGDAFMREAFGFLKLE